MEFQKPNTYTLYTYNELLKKFGIAINMLYQ